MTGRLVRVSGCEYFWQKEARAIMPSKAPCGPASGDREDAQGGFSLHGHRLSSLYRAFMMGALTLTPRYQRESDISQTGFFLPKILNSNTTTGRTA
jgi:hypothetical protein